MSQEVILGDMLEGRVKQMATAVRSLGNLAASESVVLGSRTLVNVSGLIDKKPLMFSIRYSKQALCTELLIITSGQKAL